MSIENILEKCISKQNLKDRESRILLLHNVPKKERNHYLLFDALSKTLVIPALAGGISFFTILGIVYSIPDKNIKNYDRYVEISDSLSYLSENSMKEEKTASGTYNFMGFYNQIPEYLISDQGDFINQEKILKLEEEKELLLNTEGKAIKHMHNLRHLPLFFQISFLSTFLLGIPSKIFYGLRRKKFRDFVNRRNHGEFDSAYEKNYRFKLVKKTNLNAFYDLELVE